MIKAVPSGLLFCVPSTSLSRTYFSTTIEASLNKGGFVWILNVVADSSAPKQ